MGGSSVPETKSISFYLVYFIILSMQIGIGVLGYQRVVADMAGYDAWISVLAAGLSIHIILFFHFKILENGGGDLVEAHRIAFGKWIGNAFSILFSLYFLVVAATIVRTYIEVVQVWMFPELKIFMTTLIMLLLVYYIVASGFRTVVGICFFGVVLPSYLIFTFAFTFEFADFRNLFPIFESNIKDLAKAFQGMSLTYLGYETILIYYPLIKEPKKAKKWAHLAILTTTLFYTGIAILTFAFFSEGQLENTIWPTLTIWKIVEMPFVERFEYIGIGNWVLIILPNICLALWCGSRIIKKVTKIRQRKVLVLFCMVVLFISQFFETREMINRLNDLVGKAGFYFNYVYIPILFLFLLIARKVRSKNESNK